MIDKKFDNQFNNIENLVSSVQHSCSNLNSLNNTSIIINNTSKNPVNNPLISYKPLFLLLIFSLILLISSQTISAEIASLNTNSAYPGETLTLTVKPSKSGFYNIIYVYQDINVVDMINVDCSTICTKLQRISYTIPDDFLGQYYFAVFDYAIEDYELEYFEVLEQGGVDDISGQLSINYIGNTENGIHTILNPEKGKNASLTITTLLKLKGCESYFVNAYLCNSSFLNTLICDSTNFNIKIPLSLSSQQGLNCYYSYIGEDYFPFYQQADNWQLYVKSGVLEARQNFSYLNLTAINYTSSINFGTLNANVWNIGLPQSDPKPKIINFGNVPFQLEWSSDGFTCISENCTDAWPTFFEGENTFQIDDDEVFMEIEGTEGGSGPVFITNYSMDYFPESDISVCISPECNDNIGERVTTYFNLKIPDIKKGEYEGEIILSLY